MNEIDWIRDLDNEVFEELQKYFPKTTTSAFRKEYPTTWFLIGMFDTGSTFIKNSIFDSCESDDYYSAKILFRSLIEHFLRFQYIFISWGKDKSDVISHKYLENSNAREAIELIKAKVSEQQLHNPQFKIKDWDEFLKDHPSFKTKTIQEVDKETQKYSFKNIARFLNETFKQGDNNMSSFLGQLIVDYSNLSSFVHGGMKSYQEIMSANNDDKRIKEYNRICGLAFQMSNSIKLFSLVMFLQTDRNTFIGHYHTLDQIIKRINQK